MKTRAQKVLEEQQAHHEKYYPILNTGAEFLARELIEIHEAIAADTADLERRLHGPFKSAEGEYYRADIDQNDPVWGQLVNRRCYILEAEPEETEGE